MSTPKHLLALVLSMVLWSACGADSLGVGASCDGNEACGEAMVCLTQFRGGACGLTGCTQASDCPADAVCAMVEGEALCLRGCAEKADCNANRSTDDEANCSSNLELLGQDSGKVCVPPSSGD